MSAVGLPSELWREIALLNDDLDERVESSWYDIVPFDGYKDSYRCKISRRTPKNCVKAIGVTCKHLFDMVLQNSPLWLSHIEVIVTHESDSTSVWEKVLEAANLLPQCDVDLDIFFTPHVSGNGTWTPQETESIVKLLSTLAPRFRVITINSGLKGISSPWAAFQLTNPFLKRLRTLRLRSHIHDEHLTIGPGIRSPNLMRAVIAFPRRSPITEFGFLSSVETLQLVCGSPTSKSEAWLHDLIAATPFLRNLDIWDSYIEGDNNDHPVPPDRLKGDNTIGLTVGGPPQFVLLCIKTVMKLRLLSRIAMSIDPDHADDLGGIAASVQVESVSDVLVAAETSKLLRLMTCTTWPHLETLELEVIQVNNVQLLPHTPVHLPKLERLTMSLAPNRWRMPCSPFFSFLHAPLLSHLVLGLSDGNIGDVTTKVEFPSLKRLKIFNMNYEIGFGSGKVLMVMREWSLPALESLDLSWIPALNSPETWRDWAREFDEPVLSKLKEAFIQLTGYTHFKEYLPYMKGLRKLTVTILERLDTYAPRLDHQETFSYILGTGEDGSLRFPDLTTLVVRWSEKPDHAEEIEMRHTSLLQSCSARKEISCALERLEVLQKACRLSEEKVASLRQQVQHLILGNIALSETY